ncbi:hypothetical protein C8R44DRAFT_881891 [Mycena epipterygia]|nr:hypothetical protein C8R44DRAFT_881891 [Mycena epipterygia]
MDIVTPEAFYSTPKPPRTRTPGQRGNQNTPVQQTPSGADTPSSQTMLRNRKRTLWQKTDSVLVTISKDFGGLGEFLQSRAPGNSLQYSLNFSPPDVASPRDINYARPCLSTWALQIVGPELRRQISALTQNDPSDATDTTQLRASTNGRAKNIRLATWDALGRVSIPVIAATYKRRFRAVWYATECMGAPTVNGVTVVRKRRPHTTVQVGAINSLKLSRNRYASGYLALPLAVWQFACKAHVDEKRIFSRFGFTVHDTTASACLDSLTDTSLAKPRESVADGIANGTMRWQIVLDNVQQYCRQRDHRLGREDVLKVGTAATAILLEDCAAGAFDLQDHLDRVMKQERRQMTIDSLYADIDWAYTHELTALHWVRVLVQFIPQLAYLRAEVTAAFKSERMTKHRLPKDRINVMQPLPTNAEHSTETHGMMRALLDFEGTMGLDEKTMEGLILMVRGDGASIAAIWRIQKFLSAHPNHYKAFRNRVPPGPEIWHTRWTELNTIAMRQRQEQRPLNLKKVDFFPTSRSMKLFFEARVLDCWRISFGAEDIIEHFEKPMHNPPDLHGLWATARKLVQRYASQKAYAQALDKDFVDTAHADMKIPLGTPWVDPVAASQTQHDDEAGGEQDEEEEADQIIMDDHGEEEEIVSESEDGGKQKKKKKHRGVHVEAADFTGDRVAANEVLFLQDMGWWVIAAHAVPDGEIGRVWEILKIWIFCFSGSSNRNYANYLLETYCLHRYEASKDYSNAMLNNWLVSLTGHKYVECDWSQEDFNKWLEEMVEHKGGDFDDHFYRHTLAPNVMHFLRIKEQMESAFGLKRRGKTHGAPHLSNEYRQLLRMHKEDQLHLFRPGRTMGHAAVNFFARGYEKLEDSSIEKFIRDSTAYSDITRDVLSGEETDHWDDETQRKFDQMLQDAQNGSASDEDSESETQSDSEAEEDSGDIGVHGMEYSDEESQKSDDEDSETGFFGFSGEVPGVDVEGLQENEELSEVEEEQLDTYVYLPDDAACVEDFNS